MLRSFLPSASRRVALRCFSRSTSVADANVATADAQQAESETHNVNTIDKLLKEIKSRSNPAYRSIMPLRSKLPWSQTLLTSTSETKPNPSSDTQPEDLSARYMHDSYSQIELPFASSPELLEQYVNAWGGIRAGKLMEHLDSLAGSIAYKHMFGPAVETIASVRERGFYIVTAAVDRLDILSPFYPIRDLRLSGQVIYTGRSSMEVAVKMEALEKDGSERMIMLGRFSMVCRDALTHKAHPVNPLLASTPEERALLDIGEAHKDSRKLMTQESLSRVPPSSEEARALHNVYLSNLKPSQDDGVEKVWMSETRLEKTLLMFPQERNVHQKIFGGYLMRLAYELGFTAASLFARRHHLNFLSLDGIGFERPVSIGSILRLSAHVAHTSSDEYPALVHVAVQANVIDVETGAAEHTNDFKFTWGETDPGRAPLKRMVVPQTYAEAMSWVDGRRALQYGSQIRSLRRSW